MRLSRKAMEMPHTGEQGSIRMEVLEWPRPAPPPAPSPPDQGDHRGGKQFYQWESPVGPFVVRTNFWVADPLPPLSNASLLVRSKGIAGPYQ